MALTNPDYMGAVFGSPLQDIADAKPAAPGDELPPQDRQTMAESLDILLRLTASLHATRVANGALELSSSELRFQVTMCVCECICGHVICVCLNQRMIYTYMCIK